MTFRVSWHTLLVELEVFPEGATLVTPLSYNQFHVTDVQAHRVIIKLDESNQKRTLQREQFESLFQRIWDSDGQFDLERLPPDGDPFPAVLSLHPRFEIDEDAGVIVETGNPTPSQLIEDDVEAEPDE